MIPESGEVVEVTAAASVQFAHGRGFRFRVIRTDTLGSTPTGWIHMTGYQLDAQGDAVARREIFVEHAGLIPVSSASDETATRKAPNAGPVRLPQQRTRTTHRSKP